MFPSFQGYSVSLMKIHIFHFLHKCFSKGWDSNSIQHRKQVHSVLSCWDEHTLHLVTDVNVGYKHSSDNSHVWLLELHLQSWLS